MYENAVGAKQAKLGTQESEEEGVVAEPRRHRRASDLLVNVAFTVFCINP